MTKRLALILLLASPLALASCSDDDVFGPSDLEVEWRLRSVTRAGGTATAVPDPTAFTIRFRADGTLAARVDCNGCGGPYRVEGEALISGPFACTLVLCARDLPGGDFIEILEGRATLQIDGNRLIASSDPGSLEFER
jgi:heat shock protein HslJ